MADDWRNFLPAPRDKYRTCSIQQQQRQSQQYRNDKDTSSSDDSEDVYSAHDVYDSEEDDESGLGPVRVVSSKLPVVKKDTYTRTIPSTSTSIPSFVKELLREEELAMLVSSAQFNSHHNLAAHAATEGQAAASASGIWEKEGLFRNRSLSSTRSSLFSVDDTEANDVDADESYASPGRVGSTTRRSRVSKTNAPRTRYVRQRPSKTAHSDVAKSGYQHHDRRNQIHKLKKIGPADKSPAGRHRSPSRSINQRHQQYSQVTQQQPAHFGRIHLEDIVRGIKPEFTLALDHDDDGDEEASEDSLAYLVSGYENSGVDDEEEEEEEEEKEDDLVSSFRRLHHTTVSRRGDSFSGSVSAVSSIAESTSPQSTLLNSSDALSEASVEALSPSSFLSNESSDLLLEQPPRYMYHKEDQEVATTAAAAAAAALIQEPVSSASSSSGFVEAATVAFAKTREALKEESEKANVRPSLTLQTMSHTMTGIAPGALSAFESRPFGSQYSLTKCNSTSSLYIDSTMAKSDVDETLRAVATVLYDKMLLSHKLNDCRTKRIVNSSSYQPSERVFMTRADIFDFMRFIFDCGQNLGAENAIITLIYVERMTELGNLSFHAINWRRPLLGALILSIKV
ncbi:hypothetical protein BGX33_001051 [Mortierella sp. NVP41]|nr:hypothetical protein BGX33_001051 [Mortierella sp. NVP41]